ncbi:4656_t:CDS:2 [Funneliformis geosporum]|uniref:747_t:CDS:1 n=1 Tax=Funneliformis geosporum TaxID=1117311 RepID=A0A9W4SRX9_9GLOM|nr:4656_t:CDS:2 [Funneliformis geosporum]CAI2178690.1 747_t:CDS:2 [Funneliformis geosporum]
MQFKIFCDVTGLLDKLPIIEETIIGKGNKYTIFAPSNQAFENIGKLSDVAIDNLLKYHIIPKETKSTDFIGTQYEQTLLDSPQFVKLAAKEKQKLIINKEGEAFTISNGNGKVGKVISADNVASNGIIQVVDAIVELPNSPTNVMNQRKEINDFGKLITAANLGNLFDGLIGVTIFAPSNEALAKLNPELLSSDKVTSIIQHHIVPKKVVFSGVLLEGATDNIKSYEGSTISISKKGKVLSVDNSVVITPDILLNNGNLHVIDELLMPHELKLIPNESAKGPPKNSSNNSPKKSTPSEDEHNNGSTLITVSILGGFVGLFAATTWILIHLKRRQKRKYLENTTTYNDVNILQIPSDNNKDKNYSGATQNNIHGNAIKDSRNTNQGTIAPNDDNMVVRNYGRNMNQGAISPENHMMGNYINRV